MKIRAIRLLAFAAVLALLLPSTVLAAPPVPLVDYPTWDTDMINVEAVHANGVTGKGVYVAVLDTGLVPNWRDYFDADQIDTKLGKGFYQNISFKAQVDENDKCGWGVEVGKMIETTWVGSHGATHGTHIASTILGYNYRSNSDLYGGFPLPPIKVAGIAPDVIVIPVKVLADYQIPALPKCDDPGPIPAHVETFGTEEMVIAGINYVAELAQAGYKPIVINMSLGSDLPSAAEQEAINNAIAAGVVVVASAGNEGTAGMGYPGGYPEVISAGASGWTKEWLNAEDPPAPYNRGWWLQSVYHPYNDIAEPTPVDEVYVTDYSSRELAGQELDVLAPGSWVRGPYPGYPGYSHLPWWSAGIGDLIGLNPGNYYYVGGTSMASPHVAAVAALMMQVDASLTQAQVEAAIKSTALPIPAGDAVVFDRLFDPTVGYYWDFTIYSWLDDATGSGLIQADLAVGAVTP